MIGARSDERTVEGRYRVFGYLGPVSSCFTLVWLATHRDRLRTIVLGGKRLSVLVIWDTQGDRPACRSDADVEAVRQVVYGDPPTAEEASPS